MTSIKLAFRKLFRWGEHTATRIFSLALGLAFGIVLLSEIFFYFSYDSFYPHANRTYIVTSNYNREKGSDKMEQSGYTSGAVGPGLRAEVPGVEAATRLTFMGNLDFYSENNRVYRGRIALADDQLFEVLPRPMVSGQGVETLKASMMCLVSSEIAANMGGDVMGQTIEIRGYPGKRVTIGGVFEKLPRNTNFTYDIAISMASISSFMWDGTNNWNGNDRYYTCVKLAKGVAPRSLAPAIRLMQEKHQNIEEYEAQGFLFKYTLEPIRRAFAKQAMDMIVILSAVAMIVLLVSLLNYLLLTVSTLVNRAKTSAIFKCYGANRRNLQGMIFMESAFIFLISLAVAAVLILILKPLAEAQVGHSLDVLLDPYVYLPILTTLIIIMIPIGYLPGRAFARTPIAIAFRTFHQRKNSWKKGLLAFQFAAAALFIALLVVVSLQYSMGQHANHGYTTENVYYGPTSGMDPHKVQTVLDELMALPEVENVGLGVSLPIYGCSGNNVMSPDGEKELFNIADLYYIDHDYLSILGIPISAGDTFSEEQSIAGDMLISQRFADMLALHNGWHNGVVGQNVRITEHHNNPDQSSRISGVYPDMVLGTFMYSDTRPSAYFYLPRQRFIQHFEQNPNFNFNILIKTHPGEHANITQKFNGIFNEAFLRGEAEVQSLALVHHNRYHPALAFRNGIYAGSMVVLLISLMGLLGYLSEETTRQRKSLAIRKINGATTAQIVNLFILGLGKLVVPFVIVGLVGAYYLSNLWMANFAAKITLHWYIFALSGIAILALTGIVAAINSWRAATRNPVEALRYE